MLGIDRNAVMFHSATFLHIVQPSFIGLVSAYATCDAAVIGIAARAKLARKQHALVPGIIKLPRIQLNYPPPRAAYSHSAFNGRR